MLLVAGILLTVLATGAPSGQSYVPQSMTDDVGEAVIRRTDPGADDDVGAGLHGVPDLRGWTLGRWLPVEPQTDPYLGMWNETGPFLRLDISLVGLVNPAGPILQDSPVYDPYRFGPDPVVGFIEIDVDGDAQTGGEVGFPQIRYVANVARFGGLPTGPQFFDRLVVGWDFAGDGISAPPFYRRSGEEFHLVLRGDEMVQRLEDLGDGDMQFEAGEVWRVRGRFLHRAHGYETYSLSFGPPPGTYLPQIELRYQHQPFADRTVVSLVYPLTNAGSAWQRGEAQVETADGFVNNQNSIEEALDDLIFSVQSYPPGDPARDDPVFDLLADWEGRVPLPYLAAEGWRVTALVGMPYVLQPSADRFAATDVLPDPRFGDVNGNGIPGTADRDEILAFIQMFDGAPSIDQGPGGDQRVDLGTFGPNFHLYDLNYDGSVGMADTLSVPICGDLDGDGDVDGADAVILIEASLDPASPLLPASYPVLVQRGDFTNDGLLDGDDLQGFADTLFGGSTWRAGGGFVDRSPR